MLIMAAYPIDQVQQCCNERFEKAREKVGPKYALWEAAPHSFFWFGVGSGGILAGGLLVEAANSASAPVPPRAAATAPRDR